MVPVRYLICSLSSRDGSGVGVGVGSGRFPDRKYPELLHCECLVALGRLYRIYPESVCRQRCLFVLLGVELLCPGGLETQGLSLRGLDAQSVQSHVSYLSGYGSNS